jgi:starch synthase
MKGGIVYSNFVTTVSPNYAGEIRHSDLSYGLGHTLYTHGGKFGGILNGVDYDVWNPEIDRHIPARYGIDTLDDKYKNKEAARHRFLLRQGYKPIIAYIGRLDHQKGVELIRDGIFYALANGSQFVLLGSSPDHSTNNYFLHLKHRLNDNQDCHLEIGYNEELSHLIYAGADMILVPSLFEPCGLTQMIALKYGTVPIVRATGGLVDTVFDADYAHKPYKERNGYVFHHFNYRGLESAMHRAIGMWFAYPEHFRELMINGMTCDYSWNHPAQHYLNIYEHIRDK